jgi:hypothetical protein
MTSIMSTSVVHDIVPNADTIIFLKNPCIRFAEWSPSASVADSRESARGDEKHSIVPVRICIKFFFEEEFNEDRIECYWGGLYHVTSTNPTLKDVDTSESNNTNDHSNAAKTVAQELDKALKDTKFPTEEGIRFRVCSGNLISASPWFSRLLQRDGWMESHRNPEDNMLHISAEDWDEEAFVIMMNIFHLRNRQVPRTVTLDMLAKIAVVADYYECTESIELFVEIWLASLKTQSPIPTTYCLELIMWIWVSWTFKWAEIFKQSTDVAIKQCDEPFQNLGLPIPSIHCGIDHLDLEGECSLHQTDMIDTKRCRAIETILSRLDSQLHLYRSASYSCPQGSEYSFRCGCMLLGALTKGMDSIGLTSPQPEHPFSGQSVHALCEKIRSINTEQCHPSSYRSGFGVVNHCDLSTALKAATDLSKVDVKGLNLDGHRSDGLFW